MPERALEDSGEVRGRSSSNFKEVFGSVGYLECSKKGRVWMNGRGGDTALWFDEVMSNDLRIPIMLKILQC
jgi:hypothetical protein